MTLGTGTRGSEESLLKALAKGIQKANPDETIVIASGDSEANARRLRELCQMEQKDLHVKTVEKEDDLNECYRVADEAIQELLGRDYQPGEISADITSGTKTMTASLAIAAALRGVPIRYISGQRDGGIVVPGTEKIMESGAFRARAALQIEIARSLLRELRFDGATRVLEGVDDRHLSDNGMREKRVLIELTVAFQKWDLFDHQGFLKAYGEAEKDRVPEELMVPKETLARLEELAKMDSNRPDATRLADLFNNASRRFREGKFDDAVARLYRCLEMAAQIQLRDKHGIDTADVKPERIPPGLQGQFPPPDPRTKKIQVGLRHDYLFLKGLGDRWGAEVSDALETHWGRWMSLGGLIKTRNHSILAHGFQPVNERQCEELLEQTRNVIREAFPEFERDTEVLRFPLENRAR